MCFSAVASFGSGVVLSLTGIATIKKASHSQFYFACIPLLFGLQQITEGFLWISLKDPVQRDLQHGLVFVFLFFAQVIWPVWVPWSVYKLSADTEKNSISQALVWMGVIVSLYLGYCLLTFPVDAQSSGKHIEYIQQYPDALKNYIGILYLLATIVPPFISPVKHMWSLGTAIFISYLAAAIFYTGYVVSVWCFFAAVISVVIYWLLLQTDTTPKQVSVTS